MSESESRPSTRLDLAEARKRQGWSQQDLADHLGTTQANVSRWECGITTPSPYYRTKLVTLLRMSIHDLLQTQAERKATLQETLPPDQALSVPRRDVSSGVWSVPYPRNPFFTGREDLLHLLHKHLTRDHTLALTQSWAIGGLGGIGKTQTALEYAYRYRHAYHSVFWLSAATQETLISSLVGIAELVQLSEEDLHDHSRLIQAVKAWFASQQQWLLILDNVEDMAVLPSLLPTEHAGHVLLTTRAQAVGVLAQRIEVQTMGMVEATFFLLRRAHLLAPGAFLDEASDAHLAAAEAIAIEMDFLPLALDQAGAYIEEVGCSLSSYLEIYRMHRKALLHRRGHVPGDYPESVATTWSLSFEKIEHTNPAAAELLRLCSSLSPDHIPEELLTDSAAHWSPLLQQAVTDRFRFNELLEILLRFSLVKRQVEEQMLSIHRLVQAVQIESMEPGEQRQWATRVVLAVNEIFPRASLDYDPATWSQCLRYLEQAQACDALVQHHRLVLTEAADLLNRTGNYLREHASYIVAEPLFQRALGIFEQQAGPEHPGVATSLKNLAHLYSDQGKYGEAELLYQRAVCIFEQQVGPKHPDLAASLNGLAILYCEQGKYGEAEPLFQRALRIREQHLGPEHSDVATLLNHLANLYCEQGEYEEAEPLFQRSLWIVEQHLGLEHPHVTYPLEGLASLYSDQGKYREAEPLYQRSLRIVEQHLGLEHPDVVPPLNNLADLYREQGKDEEAEPLYQRAVRIFEQQMGREHPRMAYPLTGLALLSSAQGKYAEAEPLFRRALSLREHTLEPHHPHTAETLHGFTSLRVLQGHEEEAAEFYRRALVIREHVFGLQHPKTIETRDRLRAVLTTLDRTEEAAQLDAVQPKLVETREEEITNQEERQL